MDKLSRKRAVELLWSRGVVSWKLYDYQRPIYDLIKNSSGLKFVLNCSRRFGKTTILCLISIEFALNNANAQIRFAAPTQKSLKKIIQPIFSDLLKDCPDSIKPVFKTSEGVFVFNNGSEIHIAGTDNGNAERLRGAKADLCIVDEAGFCSDLDYLVRSVLLPQTLTTGGKVVIISTPAKTPAHDFTELALEAMDEGSYAKRTIYDNKSLSPEKISQYAKESGGINSSTWKREYLCEFVVDEESQIIPEWKDDYKADVPRNELYNYWHKYVALDLGVKDLTACIFGYYDFQKAALVVEDEFSINGPSMTTPILADLIRNKERALWGDNKPYRRISDNNNLHLLQDLGSLHQVHFIPTNKESLDAMINEVRMLVDAGRVIVSPKCEKLLGCLKYGVWNKDRSSFDRSSVYGHFDHLAALVYLIRNLDKHTNPIKQTHGMDASTHFIPDQFEQSKTERELRKLFKR